MIKDFLIRKDLSKTKSIKYGQDKESEALKKFKHITGLDVEQSGIWIS